MAIRSAISTLLLAIATAINGALVFATHSPISVGACIFCGLLFVASMVDEVKS